MNNKHGGKRKNAGRKPIGTTKRISLTLPEEHWEKIKVENLAEYLRNLVKKDIEETRQCSGR